MKLDQLEVRTYKKAECSCFWFRSYLLPCAHVIRVMVVLNQVLQQRFHIDLESTYGSYWLREGGGFRVGDTQQIHMESDPPSSQGNDEEPETQRRVRLDRERLALCEWACNLVLHTSTNRN